MNSTTRTLALLVLLGSTLVASQASAHFDGAVTRGYGHHGGMYSGLYSGAHKQSQLWNKATANVLGLSSSQLRSELSPTTTIDSLLLKKGLIKEDIYPKIVTEYERLFRASLDAQVTAGILERAEANEILARREKQEREVINSLAEAMGKDVNTIAELRIQGKSLDQIITTLGLNRSKVLSAIEQAKTKELTMRLDAQVSSGVITKEKRDAILEKHKSVQKEHFEYLAKKLALTTDELTTLLDSGKTIDEILKEKGVTEASLFGKKRGGHIFDKVEY